MQFGQKLLSALGAVLLAALLLMVAAPKTVHAVVATLVQVSNTPSNPAITLEEEAQSAFVTYNICNFNSTSFCTISPVYTVPESKIAVIESASVECYIDPGTTIGRSYMVSSFNQPQPNFLFFPPPQATLLDGGSIATTGLSLKSYATGAISFAADSSNSQSPLNYCQITLSGHLE